jgi:hypothetical protein
VKLRFIIFLHSAYQTRMLPFFLSWIERIIIVIFTKIWISSYFLSLVILSILGIIAKNWNHQKLCSNKYYWKKHEIISFQWSGSSLFNLKAESLKLHLLTIWMFSQVLLFFFIIDWNCWDCSLPSFMDLFQIVNINFSLILSNNNLNIFSSHFLMKLTVLLIINRA